LKESAFLHNIFTIGPHSRLHHIDDQPTGGAALEEVDFTKAFAGTEDQICCVTASDNLLIVVGGLNSKIN